MEINSTAFRPSKNYYNMELWNSTAMWITFNDVTISPTLDGNKKIKRTYIL